MDAEDFEHEEFGISKSVGLAFHGKNLFAALLLDVGR
jgi:hypothetical protein